MPTPKPASTFIPAPNDSSDLYRREITNLVSDHRGRIVDATGDNALAEFPTALDAVEAAVEIQKVLAARNSGLPDRRRMEFRIGVHLGDVTVEGERIYGDGVNISARLQALATPGGICISGAVHDQVDSKLDLRSEDLGERRVKNIPKPLQVFRLNTGPEVAQVASSRQDRNAGNDNAEADSDAGPGKPRRLLILPFSQPGTDESLD